SRSIRAVSWENSSQEGHRCRYRFELAFGHLLAHLFIEICLYNVHGATFMEITVINFARTLDTRAILRVRSPVGNNEIHPAITVEVSRRYAVPPAHILVQTPFHRGVAQATVFV